MKGKRATGELKMHRDGYGFVITGKADDEDVFIPARFIGDALHTDLVQVSVIPGRKGKQEGRINKVLERGVKELVGRLEKAGRHFRVIADDLRVRRIVKISDDKLGGAKHGQNVIVKIIKYPKGDRPMEGEIIRVLGSRGEIDTEIETVIVHHQLPTVFNKKVLGEADACTVLIHKEDSIRKDLQHINFVTIDGETARDFDDAVAVSKMDKDLIRLWVSIADVSHFVSEHSALDREAFRRGNSVYFPDDCLPMLPEQLSNDLCSLKPKVVRFTMTAEMDIDQNGKVVRYDIYPSIIKSRERMTYTAMKKILVERDEKACEHYQELLDDFELMEQCFERLHKKRLSRGSIDFDLPEPQIMLDLTGGIEGVIKAERHVGHMMIEEFMIEANETVAEFLTRRGAGCIYRIHERPQAKKIYELSIFLQSLGYDFKLGQHVPPKKLASIVDQVKGTPEERLINTSLLRSLAQAVYSEKNVGHYGLASKCYCHFTSPIRRYPDLIVHRLLKRTLKLAKGGRIGDLKEIAEHCSRRERVAMEAERETVKLYLAHFMQSKIGETFDGIISHVTKFGFFVELKDYFVEGVVRKESLQFDRYTFDEKSYQLEGKKRKKTYRIGDPVRVVVEDVNIPNREITFSLI